MKYIIRSLKYFVALCVICMALMALMLLTGNSALNFEQTVYVAFHTDRYVMLLTALIVLAAVYPKFGFVVRRVTGSMVQHRDQVVNAFKSAGFSLRSETEGVMTFRADGIFLKLMLLGEDEIVVSQEGPCIRIDGIRRGVARIEYRLDSYIQMTKND